MVSKSIMIETATAAGGNAAFTSNGLLTVASIDERGVTVVGHYAEHRSALVINEREITINNEHIVADEDDAELLGSTALAAGGRVLARKADNSVALVKGKSGWVGVRA